MAIDGGLLGFSYHLPSVCVCVLISFSYRDTNHIELGGTLITHFNLITSFETLTSNTVEFYGTRS